MKSIPTQTTLYKLKLKWSPGAIQTSKRELRGYLSVGWLGSTFDFWKRAFESIFEPDVHFKQMLSIFFVIHSTHYIYKYICVLLWLQTAVAVPHKEKNRLSRLHLVVALAHFEIESTVIFFL